MLRKKIVRPERRQIERRSNRLSALGEAVAESPWSDRRVQCWNLEAGCTEERRKRCSAYFVRRNCWDLWAAEYFPPGRKPCCHPELECDGCAVAEAKFEGDISIYVETPRKSSTGREATPAYCGHLFNLRDPQWKSRPEIDSKSEFKCRRRPGIVLHESYVSEVCSCREHRECVFYESE